MSFSFAGIGLMSLKPFSDFLPISFFNPDIRSIFCLAVFAIVFLVLAYLTNPSENSFRAYLTEQSFRQHLSRLDDALDECPPTSDKAGFYLSNGSSISRHTLPFNNRSPFHFANRASVSLRTPKHVFHSFGVFTIAAMMPLPTDQRRNDGDGSMISDSWFIGAFGNWWRGGILETWYQDVLSRSNHDEESWSSGILRMKTLDSSAMHSALPGLPFSTKSLPPHAFSRGSPPRLRNREKSSQRSTNLLPRSSGASDSPPLPKSAGLPLHGAKLQHATEDRNSPAGVDHSTSLQTSLVNEPTHSTVVQPPSMLFDQSPRVAELLHQISLSQANMIELRAQAAEQQSGASQLHSALQSELELCRERKRQEDATRTDLKARTKALDDSKRAAESLKKDAEKRLKAAKTAREQATQRMEKLDLDIAAISQKLQDLSSNNASSDAHQRRVEELSSKRKEIKVAEEVVSALTTRARQLEERLASEKERLQQLKHKAYLRKQQLAAQRNPFQWRNVVYDTSNSYVPSWDQDVSAQSKLTRETSSFIPPNLSLAAISNFSTSSSKSNGNSSFADRIHSLETSTVQQGPLSFSPFALDTVRSAPLSPTASLLIPTGLITETPDISRSLHTESDPLLDRDWRSQQPSNTVQTLQVLDDGSLAFTPLTASPISTHDALSERDPFEVYPPSNPDIHSVQPFPIAAQIERRGVTRNNSDPTTALGNETFGLIGDELPARRRWLSAFSRDKPKTGLNPDAKVFDMSYKHHQPANSATQIFPSIVTTAPTAAGSYDALNPNGLASSSLSHTTDNRTFLRAFAPSPAEREQLQRKLGSTNTSLERLPSLSDVGSIPSSPSHGSQSLPEVNAPGVLELGNGSVGLSGPGMNILKPKFPVWLQNLQTRKTNFSPWDDEDQAAHGVQL